MLILPAATADLDALVALESCCFPAGERWSGRSWAAEVDREHHAGFVARDAHQVVGAAAFSVVDDTADLLRIAVHPTRRRQMIAGRLLAVGIDWSRSRGAGRVLLEVRDDNTGGLALYRGRGFVPISRRPDYYGPQADAIVMELRFGDREAA